MIFLPAADTRPRQQLDFTDAIRAFIASTNAPGARYDITRIHSEAARRWERLDPCDRDRALAILERLPLAMGHNKSAGLASGAPVP